MEQTGLSMPEARARLQTVAEFNGTRSAIEAELGERFGGMWLDPERAFLPVVAVKAGTQQSARRAVESLVDQAVAEPVTASVVEVGRSLGELKAAQARARAALGGPSESVTVSFEEVSNGLAVTASGPLTPSQRDRVEALRSELPVKVTEDAPRYQRLATCNSTGFLACSPFRGGTTIQRNGGGRCTQGLLAQSKTDSKKYILTAGHCASTDGTAANIQVSGWTWNGFESNGATRYYGGFQNAAINAYGDSAIIRIDPLITPNPRPVIVVLNRGDSVQDLDYYISNDLFGSVGTPVCYTGAQDAPGHLHGSTRCGTVTNSNYTPPGSEYAGQTYLRTNMCNAIQGDSGGPVYSGHVAYGLIAAGIVGGCDTIVTRSDYAEVMMNVNIVHGTS